MLPDTGDRMCSPGKALSPIARKEPALGGARRCPGTMETRGPKSGKTRLTLRLAQGCTGSPGQTGPKPQALDSGHRSPLRVFRQRLAALRAASLQVDGREPPGAEGSFRAEICRFEGSSSPTPCIFGPLLPCLAPHTAHPLAESWLQLRKSPGCLGPLASAIPSLP